LPSVKKIFHTVLFQRILRIVVSAGLIAFLLTKIPLSEVWNNIQQTQLTYILVVFLLIISGILLSSYKWKLLLSSLGLNRPLGKLVEAYFIGTFFNNILPTTIGGDVIRTMRISAGSGKTSAVAVTVLVERATGLIALLFYALAAWGYTAIFLPDIDITQTAKLGFTVIGTLTAILIILIFLFMTNRLTAFRKKIIKSLHIAKFMAPIEEALLICGKQKRVLFYTLGISFIFQFTAVLSNYCIALSLGIHLPFVYFLLFVPVISLALMLPISIGGIGVRESLNVLLWANVGLSSSLAISMSFISFILLAAVGSAGGIIYVIKK
jgi:glycosyltransferase 2 family protein